MGGCSLREFEALCTERNEGKRPRPGSTQAFLERCIALGLITRTQDQRGTLYWPTTLLWKALAWWEA